MKRMYSVVGTHRLGNYVRLFLKYNELIKEKEGSGVMDAMKMMGNLGQLQEDIQIKAQLAQQPDVITISYEEWSKHQYKVDDIIWIEVTSDGEM